MKSRRRLKLATGRRALFRITESARRELQKLVFKRHPDREWGSFFRFGFRRTTWGLAMTFVDVLAPRPGELDRNSGIVSFNPDYIDRIVDEVEATNLAIGVIHSHPSGWGVTPSELDDDMDHHFGTEMFPPFTLDRPYASLIVNVDHSGDLVFSGRVYIDGEWLEVSALYSGGDRLLKIQSDLVVAPIPHMSDESIEILRRWIALVGNSKAADLRNAVVGVVGCSGTGSPAVEALARAQIGNFVLIDPDILSISNIERLHGSRLSDLKNGTPPYKVQLMARMIREVNPNAQLTLIVGNSMDDACMNELLRCDIVLFCTDTVHGRAHAGDLATRFLIPVIDVGVLPDGTGKSMSAQMIEIMRLAPGDSCSFCRGRIDPLELHREMLSPEEVERSKKEAAEAQSRGDRADTYWKDKLPQLPSVGYLTTCAGSLAAGYALNWLLGTARMPHDHFQMDVGRANFGFVPIDTEINSGCTCQRFKGYSDQGELSIYMPPHFLKAFEVNENDDIEEAKKNSRPNPLWRRILRCLGL